MKSDLELKIVPVFVICLLFFVYFSHEQTKLFLCVCVSCSLPKLPFPEQVSELYCYFPLYFALVRSQLECSIQT